MKELTIEQQAAVDCASSNILLTACAGSGKSTTLVERLARTIESGVHPNRILAITYTVSAAFELDRKLCRRMGWVEAAHVRTSSLGYVGTLHGFCVRVLKQFGPQFGFPEKFGIMSEEQAKDLLAETAKDMRYKGSQTALEKSVAVFPTQNKIQLDSTQIVAAAFYGTLAKNNLLTFDLVLHKGLELLRKIAAEPTRAWRYEYLFVDEYQDASDVDAAIYDTMPCSEKFKVGDVKQSIYGFRGGNVENITRLISDPLVAKLNLTTNFRSDVTIVNAANRLMNGDYAGPDMVSASKHNGMVGLVEYPTAEREIVGVADTIQNVLAQNSSCSVAVLVRTNSLVTLWQKGLEDMGLKVFCRVLTLPKDWQMVLTYLALLNDPDNDWLAYKTLVAFRGKDVADELRQQSLTKLQSINQIAMGIPAEVGVTLALNKLKALATVESMTMLESIVATAPPEFGIADLLLAAQRVSFPEQEQAGVMVSTYHGAKGLEYDMVCLPAFEDGLIPLKSADAAEEQRLAYVGLTRARHILQISYALARRNPFTKKHEPAKRSRFLNQIAKSMEAV